MPTSINPYVVFLGASPGNSQPADGYIGAKIEPYDVPTAGLPHPGVYCEDKRNYWPKVRELGRIIVRANAPSLDDDQADSLIGQLNLGTARSGQAENAELETEYLRWVPSVLLNDLRPAFVILLGLTGILQKSGSGFDPANVLKIDWRKPDRRFPLTAYAAKRYEFSVWTRTRPDGKPIHFVAWPQHPSRAPMTKPDLWRVSGQEFRDIIDFLPR